MEKYKYFIATCAAFLFITTTSFAQDKEAKIALTFAKVDTNNVCTALITSEGIPVKEISVSLFVKRLFSPLPVGSAKTTDTNGIVSFIVPQDIPSTDGKLTIIAKIIDDDNYKNTEAKGVVNWGIVVVSDNSNVNERSLFAAENRAPIYFIAASLIIVSLVWGTLMYAIFQIFKIKRLRSANKKSINN